MTTTTPPFPSTDPLPAKLRRPRQTGSLVLVACLLLPGLLPAGTPQVLAQQNDSQPSASLGAVSFESSAPPAVQETFQAAVAALHSFFYDEAADLFREVQEQAPGFAMAYWGEAMTFNHPLWAQQDRQAALEVLRRLGETPEARAAKAPTEREKEYLRSLEVLYGTGDEVPAPKEERDQAYSDVLKNLAATHRRDEDAAAFYALSLQGLTADGVVKLQHRMRSAAVLERLFDRHREHPGVLHYLIHAYDDPIHAPLGLRPAVLYARVAPAAPHALHMPSHIFVQLGHWERVVASNVDAYQASVDWVERRGHSRAREDFHSLSWLGYGYLQQGQLDEARNTLEIAETVTEETGDPWVRHYRDRMHARLVIESRRWQDLEVPDTRAGDHGSQRGSYAALLFADGAAAVRRDDLDAARHAHQLLADLAEETGDDASRVSGTSLAALIKLAEGLTPEALTLLDEATALEDRMELPMGPPMPVKPSHELYGEVLLEMDRPAEAAEQFEKALRRTPNRALSLLGAARAAKALGDEARAREHYRLLAGIWQKADEHWQGLDEVRQRAGLAGGGAR